MKRLIIAEFKKIWIGRKTYLLVIAACLMTLFLCFESYYKFDTMGHEYKNASGKTVEGLELLKARDDMMHQYAGTWSQEKQEQIFKDLDLALKEYPRDQIDVKAMQDEYGKDWAVYLEKEKTVGLTQEDIDDICRQTGHDVSYRKDDNHISLEIIYTNDSQREYLSYLYTGFPSYHKGYHDRDYFSEWNAHLLNPTLSDVKASNYLFDSACSHMELQPQEVKVFEEYLMSEVSTLPKYFDSGLPNQALLNTFSYTFILPLLIVMIVLSNVFSIEKQYQTDQLIYPTVLSRHKITLAKFISGYSFAILMMLLQMIIVYLFSIIVFSAHSWNIMITSYDFYTLSPIVPATYLTMLIYVIVLSLFAAIAISTLTMFLSYLFEKKFVTIIIMFVFIAIGYIACILNSRNIIYLLFMYLHPLNMCMPHLYFLEGLMYNIGTPYFVSESLVLPMRWVAIGGWSIMILVINIILYRHSYQHYT